MKRRSPSTWLGRRKARERKRDHLLMVKGKLRPHDVSFARALEQMWRGPFRLPQEKVRMDDDGFYL